MSSYDTIKYKSNKLVHVGVSAQITGSQFTFYLL